MKVTQSLSVATATVLRAKRAKVARVLKKARTQMPLAQWLPSRAVNARCLVMAYLARKTFGNALLSQWQRQQNTTIVSFLPPRMRWGAGHQSVSLSLAVGMLELACVDDRSVKGEERVSRTVTSAHMLIASLWVVSSASVSHPHEVQSGVLVSSCGLVLGRFS
jgi:hypothetical protein